MKYFVFGVLVVIGFLNANDSQLCKKCHTNIYKEYASSINAGSSIYQDSVHKAVWDKHPDKISGNYKCAKCHAPTYDALEEKNITTNISEAKEAISCRFCHKISDVKKHAKANENILTSRPKTFFAADKNRKGQVVKFEKKSQLFGLINSTTGSPYHDINYSNENFYNANVCMGCHSHKQNNIGFEICNLGVEQNSTDKSCISCHMPKVKGSFANQKHSKKHSFHGSSIHHATQTNLAQYIKLSLHQKQSGFLVEIKNEATHTLFSQPLRLNQLRVTIQRDGKDIVLDPKSFVRIIGKNGKPTMPWVANSVLKDNLIKAKEIRKVEYKNELQSKDRVIMEFGYYLVNPKSAKALGMDKRSNSSKFVVLTQKAVDIE